MKFFLLLLGLVASAGAEPTRVSSKEVQAEVRTVVEAQLAAFRAEDYGAAYALAAASLQRKFSAPLFERLIKRGYPALARHARAELGLVRGDRQDRAEVVVSVYDGREQQADFRYLMVRQRAGWRIDGVEPVPVAKRGDI